METTEELQNKLQKYEENGVAKLYYALNRKAWEMADILNSTNLKNVNLDDPKDKTFDRLKVIWNDSASISEAVKSLGDSAGITGDENKDVSKNLSWKLLHLNVINERNSTHIW
jgi:hypothetical protein